MKLERILTALGVGLLLAACYDAPKARTERVSEPPSVKATDLPGHEGLPVDGRRTQGPRMMPAEVYLRSYNMLFGDLSPAAVAAAAKGADAGELFESWSAHLAALGLPDYSLDLARSTETNALMLATYERLGIVLCDRAVERDLRGAKTRTVFDFDVPTSLDRGAFDGPFDVLHRTFLGYPAKLSPGRTERFFTLYAEVVARHSGAGAPTSRFSPFEAGWAVVCYGLVRHPEFHLY